MRSLAASVRLSATMRCSSSIALLWLGSAWVLACGAAPPPEPGPAADGSTGSDEPDPRGRSNASEGGSERDAPVEPLLVDGGPCPAAYSDRAPDCASAWPVSCVRSDGAVCSCVTETWCGGAAPPPMPAYWVCAAPLRCPPLGTACTGTDFCSDAPCSWMGGQRCEGGVWTALPPGPAPP